MATEPLAAQLRWKRAEMMVSELEAVALRLFEERGFGNVTIEEIVSEARVSVRTFYRYFPSKEDVMLVRVERRGAALAEALATRPPTEPALHAVRLAMTEAIGTEDPEILRRWIAVITATPHLARAVLGGVHLKIQPVVADFLAERLDLPANALPSRALAAAVSGVIQVSMTHWFRHGGDLTETLAEGLGVLEGFDLAAVEHTTT